MISQAIIEEIKYRNDIEDVISGYVPLKRAGSNLMGRCPFHSERTPSFTVFTGTKSFYCFGCGVGGDVISFIMRAENLEYPDALQFLAKRAGIDIPEDDGGRATGVKKERIIDMNREAARFYHENLMKSKDALEYLKNRGLPMPLVRHFGIGYASDSFGMLTDFLSSKGYTAEEMKTGFLCGISNKTNRPFDIFRNRIMFPIIDVSGNIIAFGGRIINDGQPKYLNSSDTPAFKKSRNLFALNYARTSCAEQMILCEGYMDVIALHGAGFTNAVATLGTALTPDQARIMKRYTKTVIISYDADEAGQRAADKAFGLLGEAGVETRLLKVENAKDPDEYIKKFGKESFKRLLEGSRTRFEFKFANITAKYDIESTDGKVKAAAEAADMLSSVWSEVERDVYIRTVSVKLDIPYESLKADVKRRMYKNQKKEKKDRDQAIIRSTEGYGDRVNPERMKNLGAAGAEEAMLGILTMYPELIKEAAGEKNMLAPEDFCTAFNKRVYEKMLELGTAFDIGLIGSDFNPDEISRITKMAVARQNLTENGMSVITQCTEKLKSFKEKSSLSLEELLAKKRK